MSVEWTPFKSLPAATQADGVAISADSLAETLDGGQAFRWRLSDPVNRVWEGTWGQSCIRVALDAHGALLCSSPIANPVPIAEIAHYFALDTDFDSLTDALPWRSDPVMSRAIAAFPGLRILRQPLGETLLTFLCSATKQILQIKQMAQALATRFGDELIPGVHALPSWETLANVSEADIRACGIGFRARYIHATARILAERPDFLDAVSAASYLDARAMLTTLPGVGLKIADCVLLFGDGRLEAFPIDVWVRRVMEVRYDLQGWRPEQVAHFAQVHFGPQAGLAQQFLFSAERRKVFEPSG